MNKILSFTLLGIVAIFLMLTYESKFKGDVIKLGMSAPFSGDLATLFHTKNISNSKLK